MINNTHNRNVQQPWLLWSCLFLLEKNLIQSSSCEELFHDIVNHVIVIAWWIASICLQIQEVGSIASFNNCNKNVQHTISYVIYCFSSSNFPLHYASLFTVPAIVGLSVEFELSPQSLLLSSCVNMEYLVQPTRYPWMKSKIVWK